MGGASSIAADSTRVALDGHWDGASDSWVTVQRLEVTGKVLRAAEMGGQWNDQGFGNQKGRLGLALVRDEEDVCFAAVQGVAPHNGGSFQAGLDESALSRVFGAEGTARTSRTYLEVRIVVGGGGGHELYLQGATLTWSEQIDQGGSGRVAVEGKWSGASNDWVCASKIEVTGKVLKAAKLAGSWTDQGFGNQKGRLRLVLSRGGADAVVAETAKVAPHSRGPVEVVLDASKLGEATSCLDTTSSVASFLEVRVVVGGGGGHALELLPGTAVTWVEEGGAGGEEAAATPASQLEQYAAIARRWVLAGDEAELAQLPSSLKADEVREAFGPELVGLLQRMGGLASGGAYSSTAIGSSLQRLLRFYGWVLSLYKDRPFFEGSYGPVLEETQRTTNKIVDMLMREFTKLVDCDDAVAIRKIVSLDRLDARHKDAFAEGRGLDLERISDQLEFEREAASLVMQMWADTKRFGGWGDADPFLPSSLKHQRICDEALSSGKPDSVVYTMAHDEAVFGELREWIATRAQLASTESLFAPTTGAPTYTATLPDKTRVERARCVNYKPLQSLFNKAYVRRGQMQSASIAGDLRRATFVVETQAELDAVAEALRTAFQANYARKVDKFTGTAAAQLQSISEMEALDLPNSGQRVILYRFKANSSQNGKPNCELYNLNFFIGAPSYYQSGLSIAYICACEIQLGVRATVEGLRKDHTPYEKQRILDALPLLAAYKDGKCAAGAEPHHDYAAVNRNLFRKSFPLNTSVETVEHVPENGRVDYRGANGPGYDTWDTAKVKLINDVNFAAWLNPLHAVLWTKDVDPDKVQNVEHLFVDIRDQGWGNEGLLVALCMQLGPYVVTLASRGFNTQERKLYQDMGGIYLISKQGYNFSGFSDKTIIPKGVSKIMLVACGRLTNAGHAMSYGGLTIRIATVAEEEA